MIKIFIFLFIFLWKIHNLRDYLIYKVTLNMFIASNLKIGRILRSTIRSYYPRSYLPPAILHRIPILTTLLGGRSLVQLDLIYSKNEQTSSKNLILISAQLIFISHIYGESVDLRYPTMVQFLLTVK